MTFIIKINVLSCYFHTVKKIFFSFLTVLMLFSPLMPIVDYVLRYDYISEVLCENRSKPEKHCHGKCYLAKSMKKAFNENSENGSSTKDIKLVELVFALTELPESNIKNPQFNFEIFKFSEYKIFYCFHHFEDFFHPPVNAVCA